jgi:alkyl hydroperoxide reductase subunit D
VQYLDALGAALAGPAKDVKLNLSSVLTTGVLNDAQRWGVAVACAIASRNPALREAVLADARAAAVDAAVIDDAIAAASLMAMNNVYYRFRHFVADGAGKSTYAEKPARLRMQRIARPATNRADFELFCLAVSAINGCQACVVAHEKVVLEGGLTEDQVHDAVRIAAVVHATAVALEASAVTGPSAAAA